jgi:glycosyltransferase involved in cell wall biosynthesis
MNSSNSLLLTLSDPSCDPRPKRAFALLNDLGLKVDTVSFDIKGDLKANNAFTIQQYSGPIFFNVIKKAVLAFSLLFSRLFPFTFLREQMVAYRYRLAPVVDVLKRQEYRLILVEDLFFLPLVMKYKRGAKVVFDAREYYPRQREDSALFRAIEKPIRTYLCKKYLKNCDLFITVSSGLADEYLKEFGVAAHVIRSTPAAVEGMIGETIPNQIRLVHHGVANRNRKLENMIQLVALLDERFTLDLYLQGDQAYIAELKAKYGQQPRVQIKKPVLFHEIIPMLRKYDVGLFYVEPTTFNLTHCLPNKLFEYIQARLVVAIGPSPDMQKIVREYDCGVVAEQFDLTSMADVLNKLNFAQILTYKLNSDKAAHRLNWEEEGKYLQTLIRETCELLE